MRLVVKGGRGEGTTVKQWPTISLDDTVMFQRQVSEVRHYVANMELQVCPIKHPSFREVRSHEIFWRPWKKKVLFSLKGTSMKHPQEGGHKLRSFLTILKHLTLTLIVNCLRFFFGPRTNKRPWRKKKAYLMPTLDSGRSRKRQCLDYCVCFRSGL